MCLLLVASPNSTPKRKDLECASCNNPHGFGYAVVADGRIITGRGMSAKKVVNEFLEVRKQYPTGYAIFHARYATHGVKNEENCHPFKVGTDSDTYLAHNGILDIDIHANDKRSDTRVFAEDTLPAMGGVTALDNDNIFRILSKWSSGSKIAILTLNPDAKHECYIINESVGHWDNAGIWWSNDSYKESTWAKYIGTPSKSNRPAVLDDTYGEDLVYECPSCLSVAYEDANPYWCEMCLSCFDCDGLVEDTCLCWTPEQDKYKATKLHSNGGYYYDGLFDFSK